MKVIKNISPSSRFSGGAAADNPVGGDHGIGTGIADCLHSGKGSASSDTGAVCLDVQFRQCVYAAGVDQHIAVDDPCNCGGRTAWNLCSDLYGGICKEGK